MTTKKATTKRKRKLVKKETPKIIKKAVAKEEVIEVSIRNTYKIISEIDNSVKYFLGSTEIDSNVQVVEGKYYGVQVTKKGNLFLIHTGKDGLIKGTDIKSGKLRIVAE